MVENISLEIVYRYKTIKGSEASGLMLDQLNHAGESINLLHKEIEKVREECRWTVGNFIKKLSKFIKR